MFASLLLAATTCVGDWTDMGSRPDDPDYTLEYRCAPEADGFHYQFRVTNRQSRRGKIQHLGVWVEGDSFTTDEAPGWSAVVEHPGARYLVKWRYVKDGDGLEAGGQQAGFGLHLKDAASVDLCGHVVGYTSDVELAVQCTRCDPVVVPQRDREDQDR